MSWYKKASNIESAFIEIDEETIQVDMQNLISSLPFSGGARWKDSSDDKWYGRRVEGQSIWLGIYPNEEAWGGIESQDYENARLILEGLKKQHPKFIKNIIVNAGENVLTIWFQPDIEVDII